MLLRLKRWVQPELDRTLSLLRQANDQLGRTLKENTQLRMMNDELRSHVTRLEADNLTLHHQLDLLKKANELQGQTIDRMERHQRELIEKCDQLLVRVIQLEARQDK